MRPSSALPTLNTVGDVLDRFPDIPASRIRLQPAPGTAREEDVLQIYEREKRLCELVDGVLVEKTVGYYESHLACVIIGFLQQFLQRADLGIVAGADGIMRLAPGLIRIPDVSFVRWERLPDRRIPQAPIADLAPDLAVEVLSKGNTNAEIDRKLGEYFRAGVRAVWLVDPSARNVTVHTSRESAATLSESQVLDGGEVLSGFTLRVAEIFREPSARPPEPV